MPIGTHSATNKKEKRIINSIIFNYRGAGLLPLLIALMLFSGLCLTLLQWASLQRQSAMQIYQQLQAIQIAENQWQRLWLGLDCQGRVRQNNLSFEVTCSSSQISVRYPLGEFSLER